MTKKTDTKTPETPETTPPAPTVPAKPEKPAQGGSYIRQSDGTLTRVEHTKEA